MYYFATPIACIDCWLITLFKLTHTLSERRAIVFDR